MSDAAVHDIYLEIGTKKVFASAIAWPGWCRAGWNEESAVQALLDYAPRYARLLEPTNLAFVIPESPADLTITERVKGGAGTDFGAPGASIPRDQDPPAPRSWSAIKPSSKPPGWLSITLSNQPGEKNCTRVPAVEGANWRQLSPTWQRLTWRISPLLA